MIPSTQLPGETSRSHEMFHFFFGLGEDRTHAKVAKHYRKSIALVRKLSTRYKWKDRVKTLLQEQKDREAEAETTALTQVAVERERRKAAIEERSWDMFAAFKDKLDAMLKWPIQTARTSDVISEDGKKIHRTIIVQPAKWTFKDIALIAQITESMARMGVGMPVGRSEITGKDGAPLNPIQPPTIIVRRLSDAQSKKLIEEAKPIRKDDDE